LLLARTDASVPKHSGLTCFVLDMRSPGVDIRPLRQMTGEAEFNEVHLTDVRIPDAYRLGAVNAGWHVTMTTLMNERLSIGDGEGLGTVQNIELLSRLWDAVGAGCSPVLRIRFARLWTDAQAHRLTSVRRSRAAGAIPGPEATTAKVAGASLNQGIFELAMELLAPSSTLYDSYDGAPAGAVHSVQRQFLRSRANTIEGGTTDVLLTILAERVLGLPKEPRVDDGVPWKDVARG
jgi:alkylation response protein AidB-like acyl-CoA dehydrogenase